MRNNARRPLGLLLCAALVGGLIPPEAARAVAPVQIDLAGEAGTAGIFPVAGVNAAQTPGLPSAAAPSAALISGVFAPAPSEIAASMPAAPALAISARAAAAAADSANGESPKAHAAAAPPTWRSRAAGLFAYRAPPEAGPKARTPADAEAQADRTFDGAAEKPSDFDDAVAAPQGRFARLGAGLKSFAVRRVEAFKAKRVKRSIDVFGGPQAEPMTALGRVGYGVKWGLNLVGISALMDWTIAPLLHHFAWPLLLSPALLERYDRVELLIKFGPAQIDAALAHAPLRFLGAALPMSTAMEEFTYRFVDFGLLFGVLALAKPLAASASKALALIPDAAGLRSKVQSLALAAGGLLTGLAFPLAAGCSSFSFAVAHFARWGASPEVFAVNVVAGWLLARAAYKTRGLVAPFVAHLVFDAAALGAAVFILALDLPLAGSVYSALASVVGVGALWYNWRSARKERAFKRKSPAGASRALLVAALISAAAFDAMNAGGGRSPFSEARFAPASVPRSVVVDPPVAAPAVAAPAAGAASAESRQDMIARVKASVVQIIVKTDDGTAIGSGVIVTAGGRIVTNAHVVGLKTAGQTVLVQLIDGRKVPAKILAVNHDRDQAFLQLPRAVDKRTGGTVSWPASPFAAAAPREGDEVFAMGHPFGLPFTVTKGIVSGLGERGNMYVQYLETDASIDHGNSGGPLYNSKGEIVGINTMIMGRLGFSIVAPSVVRALNQYDAVGNIDTAALGIIADLSNPDQPDQGVAVEFVRPGSAAAKAGIRPGDVILGAAGEKIAAEGGKQSVQDLSMILAQAKPGDVVEVTVVRGDAVKVVKVALDAKRTSENTSGAHDFDEAP